MLVYGYIYKSYRDELGETASGKKIYNAEGHTYSHDYDAYDHLDAAKQHASRAEKLQLEGRQEMQSHLAKPNMGKLNKLSAKQDFHQKQAEFHERKAAEADINKSSLVDTWELGLPCLKPNCPNHGNPHPNCKCYDHLVKGGPGSGIKGHMTERKPYPGEEAHNLKPEAEATAPSKTLQIEDLPAPSRNLPNLEKYKTMLKKHPEVVNGNFTYNPKTDKIEAISQEGVNLVRKLVRQKHLALIEAQRPKKKPAEGK